MTKILITCCGVATPEDEHGEECRNADCRWATLPPCNTHDPGNIHVIPIEDKIEHVRTGLRCQCNPMYLQPEGDPTVKTIVMHRAADQRPGWEDHHRRTKFQIGGPIYVGPERRHAR